MVSVNAASAALLAFTTVTVVTATRGPILSQPEFSVGGSHHPMQKGLHHHLRQPPQFNLEEPASDKADKKKDIEAEPVKSTGDGEQIEGDAEDAEGAPAPAGEHVDKEAEHADASHDEHSGQPGEGGEPMVPRTHEHGIAAHSYGWSYEFPEHWERDYKNCGGKEQSPVNLPSKLKKAKDAANHSLSAAVPYTALSELHIDNNGHNLQMNGKFGNLTLPSGIYQAAQFNFHFPSEHKVDGKRYAGEIQIVHQLLGADGTNSLAILAILLEEGTYPSDDKDVPGHVKDEISFMKKLGFPGPEVSDSGEEDDDTDGEIKNEEQLKEDVASEEEEKKEEEEDATKAEEKAEEEKKEEGKEEEKKEASPPAPSFIQVKGDPPSAPAGAPGAAAVSFAPAPAAAPAPAPPAVPVLPEKGESLAIHGDIDIGKAFAHELEGGFWHYKGSLTTPPCSETVEWFVLERHAFVTAEMVEAFKKLFPDPANSRPVQKLHGREIVWNKEEVPEEVMAKSATPTLQAGLGLLSILCVMAMN